MKKLALFTTLVLASSVASAGFKEVSTHQSGGFRHSANNVISVAKALDSSDKDVVTLEGKIIKQIDDDEFLFSDGSAQIKVEIDSHIWGNLEVTSQDRLRITGIIDKDFAQTADLDVTEVIKID